MVNLTRRSILKVSIPILTFPTVCSLHSFIPCVAYSEISNSGIEEAVNWAGIGHLSGSGEQVDLKFTRKALDITVPGSTESKANRAL